MMGRLDLMRDRDRNSGTSELEINEHVGDVLAVFAEVIEIVNLCLIIGFFVGKTRSNQGCFISSSRLSLYLAFWLRSYEIKSFASGAMSFGHCILSFIMFRKSSSEFYPINGTSPTSISNSRIPIDHISNVLC